MNKDSPGIMIIIRIIIIIDQNWRRKGSRGLKVDLCTTSLSSCLHPTNRKLERHCQSIFPIPSNPFIPETETEIELELSWAGHGPQSRGGN